MDPVPDPDPERSKISRFEEFYFVLAASPGARIFSFVKEKVVVRFFISIFIHYLQFYAVRSALYIYEGFIMAFF
jgi:hypothetical protein